MRDFNSPDSRLGRLIIRSKRYVRRLLYDGRLPPRRPQAALLSANNQDIFGRLDKSGMNIKSESYKSKSQDRIACSSIDVGMIVYNERAMLEPTLRALLDAGFDSFVILDMNSTDGTPEYIRDLLGDKVNIINFPRRSLIEYGYAEARNACAIFSTREWLLFVDADEVLIGGVENGFVMVNSRGDNPDIYRIQRKNLGRDFEAGPDAIKVESTEHHNRLYKPSFRMRYAGYIHEEIFVAEESCYRESGLTELMFDHYSYLKAPADAELKGGLYALMLLRGYNQPDIRVGTNPWWYESHVPQHIVSFTARAEAFAEEQGLKPSFYSAMPSNIRADIRLKNIMNSLVPCAVTPEAQDEVTFQLGDLRFLHSAPCARWTGVAQRALWVEWGLAHEGSRSMTAMIEAAQTWHWDRFIRPGEVALDIGGHSGAAAIPMALFAYDKAEGRKGNVVVIEANPAVIPALNVNLALNTHLGNFHSLMAAVTGYDIEEIELADYGDAQCNGGVLHSKTFSAELAKKLVNAAGARYKSPGISLETLFRQIRQHVSPNPVGFIRIDCAGYDKEIIRPCRELFVEHKPVLFIEWFDGFAPEDDADLFSVIEAIDYVAYEPDTLQRADSTKRTSNLLCIHRDSAPPL